MDLQTEIRREHNKAQAEKIALWASESDENLAELLQMVFTGDYSDAQRAAWALGKFGDKQAQKLIPYIEPMIACLREPKHDAVYRNITAILDIIEIPEEFSGELMDICFEWVQNPHIAGAIRAYSIGILAKLCRPYPELMEELRLILTQRYEEESPAFKSRAKRVLFPKK